MKLQILDNLNRLQLETETNESLNMDQLQTTFVNLMNKHILKGLLIKDIGFKDFPMNNRIVNIAAYDTRKNQGRNKIWINQSENEAVCTLAGHYKEN